LHSKAGLILGFLNCPAVGSDAKNIEFPPSREPFLAPFSNTVEDSWEYH